MNIARRKLEAVASVAGWNQWQKWEQGRIEECGEATTAVLDACDSKLDMVYGLNDEDDEGEPVSLTLKRGEAARKAKGAK